MSRTPSHLVNRIVRAGAGAGKTTDLVRRVLTMASEFFQSEGKMPHLVVTTFTRKATQELRERLMAEAMEQQRPELIDFVQKPSHLHVSTIHGVLSVFLSRYGSELGLGNEFSLISQRESDRQRKRVFRALLKRDADFSRIAAGLLETLELNPLLDCLDEYFSLYCQGQAEPCRRLDFEMLFKEKCETLQADLVSLADWICREETNDKWQDYGRLIQVLAQTLGSQVRENVITTLKTHLESVKAPNRTAKGPSVELGEFKKAVQDEISELCSFCWTDAYFEVHEKQAQDFEQLGKLYSEALIEKKTESGLLTIADLELLSILLLEENPEMGQLFAQEWDYWLIDEYQDTSPLQVRLLSSLIGPRSSFIVGDPQQSIYLFRGARAEVFAEKEKELQLAPKGQAEVSTLMVNYRSRSSLLNFFNFLFAQVPSGQFSPMQVGYQRGLAEVEKECCHLITCDSQEAELDLALARVLELQAKGVALEKICILSRANDLIQELARKAQKLDIPVQVHASAQFAKRREVQDALALLKFLLNPYDDKNLLVLLRSPWFQVADAYLIPALAQGKGPYYFRFLNSAEEPGSSLRAVIGELKSAFEQTSSQGVISVWRQLLTQYHYFDFSLAADISGRREANLWKLVSQISDLDRIPGASLLSYIEEASGTLNLEGDGDGDATPVIEPKRANLMTVHASKGLQFEYVIIVGMGKKMPHPRTSFFMANADSGKWTLAQQDPEENKWVGSAYAQNLLDRKAEREALESERVFYVAMTRAMLGVTFIWNSVGDRSWASLLPLELRQAANQAMAEGDSELSLDYLGTSLSCRFRQASLLLETLLVSVKEKIKTEQGEISVRKKWQEQQELTLAPTTSVTSLLKESGALAKLDANAEGWDYKRALDKAVQGVEMHRYFEALKYHEQIRPGSEKIKQGIEFIKSWNAGLLLEVIQNGEVEWGFAVTLGPQQLLQGQIDLWGRARGELWVVDYKTGSQHFSDKAFEQLRIYASALRRMGLLDSGKKTNLVVAYPLDKKVLLQEFTQSVLPG